MCIPEQSDSNFIEFFFTFLCQLILIFYIIWQGLYTLCLRNERRVPTCRLPWSKAIWPRTCTRILNFERIFRTYTVFLERDRQHLAFRTDQEEDREEPASLKQPSRMHAKISQRIWQIQYFFLIKYNWAIQYMRHPLYNRTQLTNNL